MAKQRSHSPVRKVRVYLNMVVAEAVERGFVEMLLEYCLKQLKLPTMLRKYAKASEQCAMRGMHSQCFRLRPLGEAEMPACCGKNRGLSMSRASCRCRRRRVREPPTGALLDRLRLPKSSPKGMTGCVGPEYRPRDECKGA